MIDLKLKRLDDLAILPTYGSAKAGCFDLYSITDITIEPHTTEKIHTGWAMQPVNLRQNAGYAGLIFARSGLATKNGIRPANCVGYVDEDYTGEIIVPLYNDLDIPFHVHCGDRIAQMMYTPFNQCNIVEVESLDNTERGEGGFGHTGIK